jgi:ligand-binding SRPBCC domain-containing protein
MQTLTAKIEIPLPRERVFAFFADAANLGAITPPELDFRILTPLPIEMRDGALIDYRIGLWRIPMKWKTRITRWNPPYEFVDEQLSGPYRTWIHTHRFTESAGGTVIEDEVRYELPFGMLGQVALPLVRRQLNRIFTYRSDRVTTLLLKSAAW